MKVKNFLLSTYLEGLNELAGLDMSPAVAFRVRRLLIQLGRQNELYEELRRDLILKHAKKNEDGSVFQKEDGSVDIPQEAYSEFIALGDEEGDEVKELSLNDLNKSIQSLNPRIIFKLGDLVVDDIP